MDERDNKALNEEPKDNSNLKNWILWLQARIPSLKESYNIYWLKQAMEGYKKEMSKEYLSKRCTLCRNNPCMKNSSKCKMCSFYFAEKSIPTVEEFFSAKYKPNQLVSKGMYIETAHEYAVLFAKHHREKQSESIKIKVQNDYFSGYGIDEIENSIENAYSEYNIK